MIAGRVTDCPESGLPNTSEHSELHRYRRCDEVPGTGCSSPGNHQRCLRGKGRRATSVSCRHAFDTAGASRHRNRHPRDATSPSRTARSCRIVAAATGNRASAFGGSDPDSVGVPRHPLPERRKRSLRLRLQWVRAVRVRPSRHSATTGSSDAVPGGAEDRSGRG